MQARPAPIMSYRSRVGGGLTILWKKNGRYDVTVLSNEQKGALSIMCRSRDGRSKCAIIACYVPPRASRFAHWRAPLFEWVRAERARLSKLFDTVIIAGDLNSRWGTTAAADDDDNDTRVPLSDARHEPARLRRGVEGIP